MPIVVNNSYSLNISHVVERKQGTLYEFIQVVISNEGRPFPRKALKEFVYITDGTTVEHPFYTQISPNQNELITRFPTDVFDSFIGNVTIHFGYTGGEAMILDNLDISTTLIPLPAAIATVPTTKITKADLV